MPTREVHHGDGVAWLNDNALRATHAIVTSLPDASELPALGFAGWRAWFIETAALVCARVHPDAVAVFYQTDIKHEGRWVDKAHLLQRGADDAGAHCLWHKIVCRHPPGTTTFGRPAYGHWLGFSRNLRVQPGDATPDVLGELGTMIWSRAMPMSAATASCTFLLRHTPCRVVVDPFCGRGTILAVANQHGMDAVGVELSKKRTRFAQKLVLAVPPSPTS